MADPRHELPTNIVNFDDNDTNIPAPLDFSNDGAFSSYSSSLPQLNDPYSDPMIQGGAFNFDDGPSEVHGESRLVQQNFSGVLPEPPIPFTCTCCQVLREIVHTNGINIMKLQIHGTLGMICHAIHYAGSSGIHQFQMLDFSKRSIGEIKVFLTKYCVEQTSAGYYIVQDPLSSYYEALCSGLEWTEDSNDDDLFDLNPNNSSGGISVMEQEQEVEAEDEMERIPKACLTEQRERAGKMKLSDLRDYFSLPIEKAAKRLNLCPTVVKKICRKEGLKRWPHRKVKSIVKQISILRRGLDSEDAVSRRAETEAEIDRLEQEMIQHCGGFAPTSFDLE